MVETLTEVNPETGEDHKINVIVETKPVSRGYYPLFKKRDRIAEIASIVGLTLVGILLVKKLIK
jgi:hypothetical protein